MQLIIVRHGQSTGNITTDDVPDGELTPLGRQQAQETAARLVPDRITHVLSSPLVRALATGTTIADATGIGQVEVWPELQEHRPNAVFPESVEAEGWDHGGETYESALERGCGAIAALRARYSPRDIVVVATHGAFASYLLRALLHIPPQLSIWFRMNNCGISRVEFANPSGHDSQWRYDAEAEIVCVNDVAHLSIVS
jgi:broad specificity phosphatase PhoE